MSGNIWHELAIAVSLVFIIEGIVPFLYPERWRKLVSQLAHIDNRTMRFTGLASMLVGVALLYLIKY
ncbi:MAG: DUF2065 domain-containing protein [Thalassolituus sp.]